MRPPSLGFSILIRILNPLLDDSCVTYDSLTLCPRLRVLSVVCGSDLENNNDNGGAALGPTTTAVAR